MMKVGICDDDQRFLSQMEQSMEELKKKYHYEVQIELYSDGKELLEDFENGFTIIPSKGGYSKKSGYMLMCAISNRDYYEFKQKILEIDPNAFIIINKCYEVNGGVKRSNLPFI